MAKRKKEDEGAVVDDLSELIEPLQFMEAWCASVRALLQSRLEAGEKIPGADLEPTAPRRIWKGSPEEVRRELQARLKKLKLPATLDVVAPRAVLTVAATERVVKSKALFRDEFGDLCHAPPTGNFTLVLGKPEKTSVFDDAESKQSRKRSRKKET